MAETRTCPYPDCGKTTSAITPSTTCCHRPQNPTGGTADRIELDDGSWADAATTAVVCSWQGPMQVFGGGGLGMAMANNARLTYSVLRTEKGGHILKLPVQAQMMFGVSYDVQYGHQYVEKMTDLIGLMVQHGAGQLAMHHFPEDYPEFLARQQDLQR